MKPKISIYLDNNSTTKIHKKVLEAMLPFLKDEYGNSASLHEKGRSANTALENAREAVGGALGVEAVDIIFTSGGTESDNLAIKGVCLKNKSRGNHVITSSIEHMAVLSTCRFLQTQGFDVTYLPVDHYGMINPADVKKAIRDDTILVSIMYANNETGTIQPIKEIADIIKQLTGSSQLSAESRIYFHTDAIQAFGKIPIDVDELGVDLLSLSAHKIYGPKGVGALYIKKSAEMLPHMHGGHQERDMRAGTVNIPGAVGFAKAAKIAQANLKSQNRIKRLRDKLYHGLLDKITGIKLNGHPEKRLSNTLNLSFEGVNSTLFIASMDLKGIYASAGSACLSQSNEKSHVLISMSLSQDRVESAVRFSLGIDTTEKDIDYCLKEIPPIVNRIRNIHG